MSDLWVLLLVLLCVYVSDSVWWVGSRSVVLSGRKLGGFRVQYGPNLPVRDGSGFYVPSLLPPFAYAVELSLDAIGRESSASPSAAGLRARLTDLLQSAEGLRRPGEHLWIYLFIVLPAAVFALGLALTWLPALGILLGLLARIGIAYRRQAAAHPTRSSSWDLAVMLLSPPGAIRAADRFTRGACEGMSPVRIVRTMASEEEFCRWARLVYFDPTIDNEPLKDEIAKTAARDELHRLFSDPPVAEAGMAGFCPRCHQQYLRHDGDCADCIDVPIRPLARRLAHS